MGTHWRARSSTNDRNSRLDVRRQRSVYLVRFSRSLSLAFVRSFGRSLARLCSLALLLPVVYVWQRATSKQYVLLRLLRIANLFVTTKSLSPSLCLSSNPTSLISTTHTCIHVYSRWHIKKGRETERATDHLYTYLPFEIEEQRNVSSSFRAECYVLS